MKNVEHTVLEKIVREKVNEISTYKSRETLADIKLKSRDAAKALSFSKYLNPQSYSEIPNTRIIAEIKKASPSAGVLRNPYQPGSIAQAYQEAGACALSILTDVAFFLGSLEHLKEVRSVFHRPILRKDFMIDDYQIYQSRAYGSDIVLAIVALLEKSQLQDFCGLAQDLGMTTLVEVHDEEELREALSIKSDSIVLGINNRNLKTLKMDLGISEKLKKNIPDSLPVICESGISNRSQIEHFEKLGFSGFLIGEHLLKEKDIQKKLKELLCPKP